MTCHVVNQLIEHLVQNSEVHRTIRPPLFLYYYPGELDSQCNFFHFVPDNSQGVTAMVVMLELLMVATLCMSSNQLSPNIVTEEVKTRVVKTKYGKVQGFVSKVSSRMTDMN